MLLENNPYTQDIRVRGEARALAAAGYRVSVVAPAALGEPKREVIHGVRLFRYPPPPEGNGLWGYAVEYGYSLLAMWWISFGLLLREGFDVVHVHCPPDAFVLLGAFYKLLGKRFVYDHHDLGPEVYEARFAGRANPWVRAVLLRLERWSLRLADHVIATNQSYKAVEMQRGGVPEARITVVRNGPDLDRVRRVPPDPGLRRKAGTVLGYVGIMSHQDGLDYLLRALRHLVDDLGRDDFHCVVVGRGSALPRLRQLAADLGLDRHVWFTGRVSDADLMRYLSTADICVVPDPSNPFNDRSTMIKVMEYMALGKPIVAFDLPEHRFSAQEAALYARPNDELDFARQIARLMDDPARREAMGATGRHRVETELAWRHSIPKLLDAYRGMRPVLLDHRARMRKGRSP